jgi:hypothetical protein
MHAWGLRLRRVVTYSRLSHATLLPSGWGDTVGSPHFRFRSSISLPAYTPVQRFKCSLTTALAWLGARMVR